MRRILPTSRCRSGFLLLSAALALAACGGGDDAAQKRGAGGPPQVGYVVVQPTSVPLTTELSGRVTASQTSEVRPQVAGIVRKRSFEEGSIVRRGQTLYQIDPSLYQAQVAEASANLQSARASAEAARTRAARYKPLAEMEAVSRQEYTDAAAQARQAEAAVAQNRAQHLQRQIIATPGVAQNMPPSTGAFHPPISPPSNRSAGAGIHRDSVPPGKSRGET